jgi:hypothetical protein
MTKFDDADYGPGPKARVGGDVDFLIEVRNLGDTPLSDLVVSDDRLEAVAVTVDGFNVGDVNKDSLLDSEEVWLFTASELAQEGQQTNTATATALLGELELVDSDSAQYHGVVLSDDDDDTGGHPGDDDDAGGHPGDDDDDAGGHPGDDDDDAGGPPGDDDDDAGGHPGDDDDDAGDPPGDDDDDGGDSDGDDVEEPGPDTQPIVLFSVGANRTEIGDLRVMDEDIVQYDPNTDSYELVFDGSDVLPRAAKINAVATSDSGELLMSFTRPLTINGIEVDDSDIVRFVPGSLGEDTEGSFELYFDGSDVGLTTNGADIDGIAVLSDGSLLLSTQGNARIPGLSGVQRGADALKFTPSSLGAETSGSWSSYLDGSDIGLQGGAENLDALALGLKDSEFLLSTRGEFEVDGLSGNAGDLFTFVATATGPDTAGNFEAAEFDLPGLDDEIDITSLYLTDDSLIG